MLHTWLEMLSRVLSDALRKEKNPRFLAGYQLRGATRTLNQQIPKAALLAPLNTTKRAGLFAGDEEFLVEHCATLRYSQAAKFVRAWERRANAEVNPDGTSPPPETYGGSVTVEAMLDPVGGEMFLERAYLRNLEVLRSASGVPPVWQVGQY